MQAGAGAWIGCAAIATGGDASGRIAAGPQATSAAPSRIAHVNSNTGRAMWVIFLEMGAALGMLLLIVWWTWPKKRPEDEDKR